MKRVVVTFATLVAAVVLTLGGPAAQAEERASLGCLRLLCEPSCHRVYFTPPGWSQPIEVTICP